MATAVGDRAARETTANTDRRMLSILRRVYVDGMACLGGVVSAVTFGYGVRIDRRSHKFWNVPSSSEGRALLENTHFFIINKYCKTNKQHLKNFRLCTVND